MESVIQYPEHGETQPSARWSILDESTLRLDKLTTTDHTISTTASFPIIESLKEIFSFGAETPISRAQNSDDRYCDCRNSDCCAFYKPALRKIEVDNSINFPITISPDGLLLASGSGRTIRVWSIATGITRHTLNGHARIVNCVSFSPNGKLIASGSEDKTIRLWDTNTWVTLRTLEGHGFGVQLVFFPLNSEVVGSVSSNTVRLWNIASATILNTFDKNHVGCSVAFSANGALMAWQCTIGVVEVLEIATLSSRRIIGSFWVPESAMAFSSDGKLLAISRYSNDMFIIDISTGKVYQRFEIRGV